MIKRRKADCRGLLLLILLAHLPTESMAARISPGSDTLPSCSNIKSAAKRLPFHIDQTNWPDKLYLKNIRQPKWRAQQPQPFVSLIARIYIGDNPLIEGSIPAREQASYSSYIIRTARAVKLGRIKVDFARFLIAKDAPSFSFLRISSFTGRRQFRDPKVVPSGKGLFSYNYAISMVNNPQPSQYVGFDPSSLGVNGSLNVELFGKDAI